MDLGVLVQVVAVLAYPLQLCEDVLWAKTVKCYGVFLGGILPYLSNLNSSSSLLKFWEYPCSP